MEDQLKKYQNLIDSLKQYENPESMSEEQEDQSSPAILGVNTDATNVETAEDAKNLIQSVNLPVEAQRAPTSEIETPEVEKDYSQLLTDYKKQNKDYLNSIQEGYEADRKAALVQNLVHNLGTALTYSGFAGAQSMSNPMQLNLKPMDFKYAEQAKESGKTGLDYLKSLITDYKEKAKGKTKDEEKQVRLESHLYDKWQTNPTTKNTQEVATAYEKVLSASNNPSAAGDVSLIFGYMRMLDPASTVREGEFATAEKAAGVPERIRNVYNKVLNGERLTIEQRKDFENQAKNVLKSQMVQQKRLDKTFKERAQKIGLDPESVVFGETLFGETYSDKEPSNSQISKPSSMVRVIDENGRSGSIPRERLDGFLKANNKRKIAE